MSASTCPPSESRLTGTRFENESPGGAARRCAPGRCEPLFLPLSFLSVPAAPERSQVLAPTCGSVPVAL
eukprot:6495249-Alexandrium_andersonii.AAC.1